MIENLTIQRQQRCKGFNKENFIFCHHFFLLGYNLGTIKQKVCWILTK